MSQIFVLTLILHVILGLIGVIAAYAVWLGLLKREINLRSLKRMALTALVSFMLSWIAGGYYYVLYYGKNVKPVILAGQYSWAHSVITESKEHLFLFLPFLALLIYMVLRQSGDVVAAQPGLKKALAYVACFTAFLGIVITLFGVLISGAVR